MQNKVIIGLGSNKDGEVNIASADELLRTYFVAVTFSDTVYTKPVGGVAGGLFLNQVAIAYTPDSPEQVISVFKQIERMLGRTPESKSRGDIPIDIDLLQWNDRALKPNDLKQEYILSLLRTLFTA